MLRTSAEKYPGSAYTNQKGDKGWEGLTYPEVLYESRFVAAGLHQLGIEKGDKIAILAEGRNRWLTSEYAILFAGGTTVPLSIKLMPDEVSETGLVVKAVPEIRLRWLSLLTVPALPRICN